MAYPSVRELNIKRSDVWMADLSFVVGSEQGGSVKPVIVLQNDTGNRYSPTIIVCVVTSRVKKEMPTHVYLEANKNGLNRDSYALLEQIKTIDKMRLLYKVTNVSDDDMRKIDQTLMFSCGIAEHSEACLVS